MAVLSSHGYVELAEDVLSYLDDWRDILSYSQVCTNLNDIVIRNVRAQVLLRAALVGRNVSSLPKTQETLERMIDVERRWSHLTPKAYNSMTAEFQVMAMSDGVLVTNERGGWMVTDFWGLRDASEFESIPYQRFVAPQFELFESHHGTSSDFFSYGDNIVASRHDNLLAVLEGYRDPSQDFSGDWPIEVKVRLHLFELFSEKDESSKARYKEYTPVPHPEAAYPVIEVGSFTLPPPNDEDDYGHYAYDCDYDSPYRLYKTGCPPDGTVQHMLYQLTLGCNGTLLVRVIPRTFAEDYIHDMPISLWDWRTGKMVMDLRLTEKAGQQRRKDNRFWQMQVNTVDTYLSLPTGNVLALGLVRIPRTNNPVEYPLHMDMGCDECDAQGEYVKPMSVFNLISAKPGVVPPVPNKLSPWRHFESSAVSCRGPTCLFSHGTPRTAPLIATDENRLLFRLSTHGSSGKEFTFTAVQLQRLLLTSRRHVTLSLLDWVYGAEANVVSLCQIRPVSCIGGLRTFRIQTTYSETCSEESDDSGYSNYDPYRNRRESTLYVSSSTTSRGRNASPLASRHPRKPLRYERPVPSEDVRHTMFDVHRWEGRPYRGDRERAVHIHPGEYEVVYAGSEHLVAITDTGQERMFEEPILKVHVWSF